MSAAEVASRWGVSRRTITRWCAAGTLSSTLLGGMYKIPLDAVLDAEICGVRPAEMAAEDPGTVVEAFHCPHAARDGRYRSSQALIPTGGSR